MKLKDLLTGVEIVEALDADEELEISGITADSREVSEGFAFVARKGINVDGHLFIEDAIRRGAVCVVYEKPTALETRAAKIRVKDSASSLARIASNFYGNPSEKLRLIGVTGTNGKTTTTLLIGSILAEEGLKPIVIGTLGIGKLDEESESRFRFSERGLTSPEPVRLQRTLREAVDAGATHAVMEASSHAIAQKRIEFCNFKVKVFTNISQDHLDFHGTMTNYIRTKKSFFEREEFGKSDYVVSLRDDEVGKQILEEARVTSVSFGFGEDASVQGKVTRLDERGIDVEIFFAPSKVSVAGYPMPTEPIKSKVTSLLIGRHNALNILAGFSVGLAEKITVEKIARGIERVRKVPGRLEPVKNDRGIHIFVDYAHTPDALTKVLGSLRELAPSSRIICVFGCGGDRDRLKRPLMAQAVARVANALIITTDNPRSEDPMEIAEETLAGITGAYFEHRPKYMIELDRRTAIEIAISDANPGDIVLVAGKGHEDYQIFRDRTIHFSDVETIEEILREM